MFDSNCRSILTYLTLKSPSGSLRSSKLIPFDSLPISYYYHPVVILSPKYTTLEIFAIEKYYDLETQG